MVKEFKGFNQSKQKIDTKYLIALLTLIRSKIYKFVPEDLNEVGSLKEGAKKQIIVNKNERNLSAREECIKFYGAKCQICGFDFGSFYGKDFEGKIHVHHKKPISQINEEYEVNPINDLIPVCPNCHLIIHSKTGESFSINEVKEFINITKGTSN
ncbi:HNH endonuclease [Mycoplasmatota bacterium]|nr:HNH endonuclease [Mycoplasmatota bacterium]